MERISLPAFRLPGGRIRVRLLAALLIHLTMVSDHGMPEGMRDIAISKFKATCLAVLEDVRKTRTPIRVTRFGKPVAEVVPATADPITSWLGSARGTAEIVGDILGPIGAFDDWPSEDRRIAPRRPRR